MKHHFIWYLDLERHVQANMFDGEALDFMFVSVFFVPFAKLTQGQWLYMKPELHVIHDVQTT